MANNRAKQQADEASDSTAAPASTPEAAESTAAPARTPAVESTAAPASTAAPTFQFNEVRFHLAPTAQVEAEERDWDNDLVEVLTPNKDFNGRRYGIAFAQGVGRCTRKEAEELSVTFGYIIRPVGASEVAERDESDAEGGEE